MGHLQVREEDRERQRWESEKNKEEDTVRDTESEREGIKGGGGGLRGKKRRKSEMSPSVNNMEQAFRNGSCDQQTCTAATLYGDMSM